MSYERELSFLTRVLKKSRVGIFKINDQNPASYLAEDNFKMLFAGGEEFFSSDFFAKIEKNKIYRVHLKPDIRYIFMRLPNEAFPTILGIGPFLSRPQSEQMVLEITEKYKLSIQKQKLLERFLANLPYVPENSPLFSMIDTFAEGLWGGDFEVVDTSRDLPAKQVEFKSEFPKNEQELLLNMKIMEERYAAENEMMRAVSQGQAHNISNVLTAFESMPFEKRLSDSLRNLKNYGIIMNTLLRKAAEQGGVHPLSLDRISSDFAKRIELLSTVSDAHALMSEMYSSYCLLVQKNNLKKYSPVVQKAILLIDATISSDISLKTLAAAQGINASHLSAVFKKETGKTVTEYINGKRMSLAAHLLKNTNLQIQSVALNCGIMDVQYFSKLFKKEFGKTPREYR